MPSGKVYIEMESEEAGREGLVGTAGHEPPLGKHPVQAVGRSVVLLTSRSCSQTPGPSPP